MKSSLEAIVKKHDLGDLVSFDAVSEGVLNKNFIFETSKGKFFLKNCHAKTKARMQYIVVINGKALYGIRRFPGVLIEKKDLEFIDLANVPSIIHDKLKRIKEYFIQIFNRMPGICRVDFLKFRDTYEVSEIELIDPDLFFRHISEETREEALFQFYAIIETNNNN